MCLQSVLIVLIILRQGGVNNTAAKCSTCPSVTRIGVFFYFFFPPLCHEAMLTAAFLTEAAGQKGSERRRS